MSEPVEAAQQRWPDGEPVTPWADPWHDVLGDVRAFILLAEAEPTWWGWRTSE